MEPFQKGLTKGNYSYLKRHPELRAIIRVLLHEIIDKEPENIYEFSAALFNCNNIPFLVNMIKEKLELMKKKFKKGQSSPNDEQDIFIERMPAHTLDSRVFISAEIESILRFAMALMDE
ncbi:uncharacterized protein LOC106090587 [Stomoxys calcitrans]|uniref:Uncharacterized protein n=1 Tax=Stomoxys calcitrans TaxID=35570 RepID=A0A1I8NVR2_STOCA|nr:uncharacterized protein LOC106090587 [Stomoxys calcitrans]